MARGIPVLRAHLRPDLLRGKDSQVVTKSRKMNDDFADDVVQPAQRKFQVVDVNQLTDDWIAAIVVGTNANLASKRRVLRMRLRR